MNEHLEWLKLRKLEKAVHSTLFSWISFSRSHDEDPGQRLENCLIFVCGRVGVQTMDSILELHDHKGCLEVHSNRSLRSNEEGNNFRKSQARNLRSWRRHIRRYFWRALAHRILFFP